MTADDKFFKEKIDVCISMFSYEWKGIHIKYSFLLKLSKRSNKVYKSGSKYQHLMANKIVIKWLLTI